MRFNRARLAGAILAAKMLEDLGDDMASKFDILDKPLALNGPDLEGFYNSTRKLLKGAPRRKLANNTYAILNQDESVAILLHSTVILKVEPDNRATIDFGGWYTRTTIDRLNTYLPPGYSLAHRYKRDRGLSDERAIWFVSGMNVNPGYSITLEASDGDVIEPDGTLITQVPPTFKKLRPRKTANAPDPDSPPLA